MPLIFFYWYSEGWSPFGSTHRSIVPTPCDYDGDFGGIMSGRGNRSIRRKPAPVPLCPPQTSHALHGPEPGRRGGKPGTSRLSYDTAIDASNSRIRVLLES
jgi:hypothetical protein